MDESKASMAKLDEHTIAVTTEKVVATTVHYDYGFLLEQKAAIENRMAEEQAARQAELDEVNALLAECEKLGVTARSKE